MSREAVGEPERPAPHVRLGHEAGEAGEEVVEVGEVPPEDLAVVELEKLVGELRREKTMMLLPGWRVFSRDRARLVMLNITLKLRFGVAMA